MEHDMMNHESNVPFLGALRWVSHVVVYTTYSTSQSDTRAPIDGKMCTWQCTEFNVFAIMTLVELSMKIVNLRPGRKGRCHTFWWIDLLTEALYLWCGASSKSKNDYHLSSDWSVYESPSCQYSWSLHIIIRLQEDTRFSPLLQVATRMEHVMTHKY
jgi:hypothetical protein